MKFQSLKTQSATLAISLLALCGTFTSCVEDEENPFRNDDDDEYAQLPGNGMFYIGSEVEMRGRGFLPSDQVWIKDYYTGQLLQARTTNCTGDKLFFVVPGGLTPNNSVEVSITQGDDTEIIGNLYLTDYYINEQSSNFDNAYDITVSGEYSVGDKLYFQEIYTTDYNTDEETLLGEPVEAEIFESDGDNYVKFTVFPLYTQYQVTFVHNGETAKTQTMNNYDLVKFTESASAGQQVTLRWRGFRSSDAILLINPYTQYGERVSTTCDATGLTFTVPASYHPGSYEIVIARYDNEKIPALVIGTLNVY